MMPFSLEHAKDILERTPAVLEALLRGLPDDWVIRSDDGESWSPFDVLGHLIHGEKTDWIPRARIILEQGTSRTFDPFDRHAMLETSRGKSLDELLKEFHSLRNENLRILDTLELTGANLGLKGMHPDLGVVTLQQLIAAWVVHDLGHLNQITRSMARQYTSEVGPWRAYMSVLRRDEGRVSDSNTGER
jgi:DinB superfamily